MSENNVHTWNNVVDSTTCSSCVSPTPELDRSRTWIRESWQAPGSRQLPTQILQILEISSVTWQDGAYTVATNARLQEASLVTKLGQKIEVVALVDGGASQNVIDYGFYKRMEGTLGELGPGEDLVAAGNNPLKTHGAWRGQVEMGAVSTWAQLGGH